MSRRAIVLLAFVTSSLTACVTPRDGQFLCPGDGDCPNGMTCADDGVCRVLDVDAGPNDAGPGDSGSEDAGPCTDGDGDGFCASEDCDDSVTSTFPGAPEICGDAVDSNCDGALNDGCSYHLGVVHSPVRVHAQLNNYAFAHFGPELSGDGRRLYFVDGANQILMAERADLTTPMGAPRVIHTPEDADSNPLTLVVSLSLRGDEREVFLQVNIGEGESRIYSATRDDSGSPFGSFSIVSGTVEDDSQSQVHPSVSRDGLELYYAEVWGEEGVNREIRRVRRDSVGEAFGAPEVLVENAHFPRLWEDSRTLSYRPFPAAAPRVLQRASASGPFEGESTPLRNLVGSDAVVELGVQHYYSERAGELWFTVEGATPHPAAPLPISMFRAQICRGSTCPALAPIECDSPDEPTEDGLHCLHVTTNASTFAVAQDNCDAWAEPGIGFRGSVHTRQEADIVASFPGTHYLGVQRMSASSPFEWDSGEPYVGDRFFSPGTPSPTDTEDCVTVTDGVFSSSPCTTIHTAICERELWPVFVPPGP